MVYYFLPAEAPPHLAKPAFSLVQHLLEADVPAAVATPGGQAPTRFMARAPVVDEGETATQLTVSDTVICGDDIEMRDVNARVVQHPLVEDDGNALGLSVSSYFYYKGLPKFEDVAVLSTEGNEALAEACMATAPALEYLDLSGLHELDAARKSQAASIYISGAADGPWALAALEAMAAGCVVLVENRRGLPAYLRHGETCWVADSGELPEQLSWLVDSAQSRVRRRLRSAAVAMAGRFRWGVQHDIVARQLEGPSAFWRS